MMKNIIAILAGLVIEKVLEKVLDIYLTKETMQQGLKWVKRTKKDMPYDMSTRVLIYLCVDNTIRFKTNDRQAKYACLSFVLKMNIKR